MGTKYNPHPDCDECCKAGRCHWCLVRPGTEEVQQAVRKNAVGDTNLEMMIANVDGYSYFACGHHRRHLERMLSGVRNHDGVDFSDPRSNRVNINSGVPLTLA